MQKKPRVERHSGSEVSCDLQPPPLPAQRGDEEELYLDHNAEEVKCEQVRIFILRCCLHVLLTFPTRLFQRDKGFKKIAGCSLSIINRYIIHVDKKLENNSVKWYRPFKRCSINSFF